MDVVGNPMNGWAKTPAGKRWHQVVHNSVKGEAELCCSGQVVSVDPEDVMDYRWQPPWADGCWKPACVRKVDP